MPQARFQHALSLGLPARQHDALFGLAESLQQTAGSIVDAASSVDLASWQAEAEAHTRAAELLSRSAATYQQVRSLTCGLPTAARASQLLTYLTR